MTDFTVEKAHMEETGYYVNTFTPNTEKARNYVTEYYGNAAVSFNVLHTVVDKIAVGFLKLGYSVKYNF